MGAAFWFVVIVVCVVSIVGGFITGIYERKHGIKNSGKGFWCILLALGALFKGFDSHKKK